MRKKRWTLLILVLVLAVLCACNAPAAPEAPAAEPEPAPASDPAEPADEPAQTQTPAAPVSLRTPDRTIASKHYSADIYHQTIRKYQASIESTTYEFTDGTLVRAYRAAGAGGMCTFLDRMVAGSGTVHYYSGSLGRWAEAPLDASEYSCPVIVIEMDSGETYFIALSRTFTPHENGTLEYLPAYDGHLRVTRTKGGFRLQAEGYGLTPGNVADCMILELPQKLDWSLDNCAIAWTRFVQNGDSQWCYDGYYRKTAYNYIPTGDDYYYRCAASYTIRGFVSRAPMCKEAAALSIVTLDIMAQQQNSYGYWATGPGSEWLRGDYGISPGFYDTRFNTDLLEIYITASRKFGMGLFDETMTRYVGFFNQIAASSHITTENDGWLVPDYWCPGEFTTPHTSLNHQAAECLALYHAADVLKRDDLRELADRMLLAIEDTGAGWVMPNHNLYYSILPDGTYLTGDYPYLTYNDLYALRKYLTGFGKEPNETLTMLMDEKLLWMRANGVSGYKTDG